MPKPIYATWMLSNNVGDALTPWLIEKITGQMPLYIPFDIQFPKFMVAGSILNHAIEYTTVWGAGVAFGDDKLNAGIDIRSVRGPLTARKVRLEIGNDVQVVGDPAWLLPRFYDPRNADSKYDSDYDVGIVPHYIHQREVAQWIPDRPDIKLINVFDSVEKFISDICSCAVIYSSSLHGLIIADAYGIPSQWIECTDRLGGDEWKFRDHLFIRDYLCSRGDNAMATIHKFITATAAELIDIPLSGPIAPMHIQQLPKRIDLLRSNIIDKPTPSLEARKALCDSIWSVCPFKPEEPQKENQNEQFQTLNPNPDNSRQGRQAQKIDGCSSSSIA